MVALTRARVRRSRKNRPAGSQLTRTCWCKQSKVGQLACAHDCWRFCACFEGSCPVHRLGAFVAEHADDTALFSGICAGVALQTLRRILGALDVKDNWSYRTHDLRRGHALDLQRSGLAVHCMSCRASQSLGVAGAPLYEILAAGEWSSPAFLQYLDFWKLEASPRRVCEIS